MEKNVLMQESEIDRMNREAKANFDRYYEAYLESPEFVMCECVKGISMSVQELLDLLKPTLADVDPRYAEALKTYVTWIKNTENEADALCSLAKKNPSLAREKLDLWQSSLTMRPPEYNRLATEIEAAGRNPAWKALDDLRYKLYNDTLSFLQEVRLYLEGRPTTDYARIAAEQASAANAKIPNPRPVVREDIIRLVQEVYTSDELKTAVFPDQNARRKPSLPRAAQYVHKIATEDSMFYDRIVAARMAAKKLYKKTRDGETQFWNSIAQAAKTSHGRKVHEELAPVAIPTGWW